VLTIDRSWLIRRAPSSCCSLSQARRVRRCAGRGFACRHGRRAHEAQWVYGGERCLHCVDSPRQRVCGCACSYGCRENSSPWRNSVSTYLRRKCRCDHSLSEARLQFQE
jgi:hypothetical protein